MSVETAKLNPKAASATNIGAEAAKRKQNHSKAMPCRIYQTQVYQTRKVGRVGEVACRKTGWGGWKGWQGRSGSQDKK